MFFKRFDLIAYVVLFIPVVLGLSLFGCDADTSEEREEGNRTSAEITYVAPNPETGFSLASVVRDVPLAFTGQVFPFDETGNIVGSDVAAQLNQVIGNAKMALKAAGTDFRKLVRIHLYVSDDSMSDAVLQRLKEVLPDDTFPSITVVAAKQARAEVLVSMDVVAVAGEALVKEKVTLYESEEIDGPSGRSEVAVLAPGRKVFVSGQSATAENISDATLQTMRNLFATLAYAGAKADDVVQVKAFFNPIDSAAVVEERIASFFHGRNAPPIVSVEWVTDLNHIEIELIASAQSDGTTEVDPVRYYAPAWMSQATTFSRIVDVRNGGLFFTSGLYGEGEDGQVQAQTIFRTLGQVLEKAGANYDHLVKATYYPSSEDGRKGFVNVRPQFYNPKRPPAASLIMVQGTGRAGRSINVDVIGIIPE